MSTSIFATVCLTCNGTGTIYAGVLHGQSKVRVCPTCKGVGEYVKREEKKPKEDKGRTGPELKAFCPKCSEPISINAHFKATRYANFTCKCGCKWRMSVEDAKVN